MKSATLTKILYSSLALSCLDSQLLCAMDIPMNGAKRTASEAGFEQNNQAPKRLCLKIPTELSELPIHEVIEKAYVDNDCRDFLIERIYHEFICPDLLNINLKNLLRLNSLKIAIETLTPFELHIICSYNPDNILNTDAGKVLIIDLQNKAQHDSSAQNTLAILYKEGLPGILEQNLDMALKLYNRAASNGYAEAQCNLAIMYNHDKNVPQDYPKALEWFTKAANQGKGSAQNAIKSILSKKNNPLLVNSVDINTLTAKMTTEIENFDFALKVALGETIHGEEKNNPTGSHNTQGNNSGMAISSLYSYFQCCPEYALKIKSILNHLTSQQSMDKGFLVTNLGLNPYHTDFGTLKKQLAKSTTCLRLTSHPKNSLSYLSFGDSNSDSNFKYSKLFQEILDEKDPEYLKMKKAVKSLKKIYKHNLMENESKALTIQYSSFTNRESLENAQNEIKLLNEIIEKNKVMLFCLKTLNGSREKLIEVIQNSTPLRNLAFSKNPLMKHF